jgi:hypothetical protein
VSLISAPPSCRRPFPAELDRRQVMMDAVYIIAGIAVLGVFAVYAAFLKRV